MQWIVLEYFRGHTFQTAYGPFPTQDQALTYLEGLEVKAKENGNLTFVASKLQTPTYMPEVIHG